MDSSTGGAEARYDEYLARALRGESLDDAALGEDAGWLRALHELARSVLFKRAMPGRVLLDAEPGLPWATLGGYRLVRKLGEGGMGVVFLAEQADLGRLVALKVLRAELALSPVAIERFAREARALARLQHPGIVNVHVFGEDQGVRYFTMELLPGENLDERIERSEREAGANLPTALVLNFGAQIADALDAAHRAGIVHRDVKPQNIRVLPDGRAVLLDFGLARDVNSADATITREFAGSPAYAAPEQIALRAGTAIDARADIYGLGATLYHALSGRPCFRGDTVEAVLHQVLTTDPVPLRRLRADCPRDLQVVIARALEKEPARRYPTAAEFAADLRAVLELRPVRAAPAGGWTILRKVIRRHPRLSATLFALSIGACGIVGLSWWGSQRARADAADRLAAAARALTELEAGRPTRDATAFHLADLERLRRERDWTDAERERAERLRIEVSAYDARRARVLQEAHADLGLVRSAGLRIAEFETTWAHLHFLRWLEVRGTSERGLVEFFRQEVLAHDPAGVWTKRLEGSGVLRIETTPPGAEVQLFQFAQLSDLDPAQSPRIVPMRALGDAEVGMVGSAAFRVVHDSGAWRSGDLLLVEPDELVRPPEPGRVLRCWRNDRFEDVAWDGNATLRPTRAPRFLSTARRIGTTPLVDRSLLPAWFVVVLQSPGYESLVLPFHVDHAEEHFAECAALRVELMPKGSTPPGFVRIAAEAYSWGEHGCFLGEREVTCREYAEFVRANDSQEHLPSSPEWTGHAEDAERPGIRFVGDESDLDAPVRGVSWTSAKAYARWRNGANPGPIAGHRYDLPTPTQWIRAAKGGDGRAYVFGAEFRIDWALGVSRNSAGPPPVMSNAFDESPFGVYDMTASVAEWCDRDSATRDGEAPVCGGSWRDRTGESFRIDRRSMPTSARDESVGFRIALRRIREGEQR
ncbi:MAG: bifunctional serine/threonine-protein kinase/formylglycine-generating enzyme family protein [Planctomycetota bacterium]